MKIDIDRRNCIVEYFIKDRIRHRNDGPAWIQYYDAELTIPRIERWYINGQLHRENAPAYFRYYKSGKLAAEEWFINGSLYRTTGPSSILFNEDGSYAKIRWAILPGSSDWITEEVEQWLDENNLKWPFDKETEVLFKLRFA